MLRFEENPNQIYKYFFFSVVSFIRLNCLDVNCSFLTPKYTVCDLDVSQIEQHNKETIFSAYSEPFAVVTSSFFLVWNLLTYKQKKKIFVLKQYFLTSYIKLLKNFQLILTRKFSPLYDETLIYTGAFKDNNYHSHPSSSITNIYLYELINS